LLSPTFFFAFLLVITLLLSPLFLLLPLFPAPPPQ